jgi:hypothetical protein
VSQQLAYIANVSDIPIHSLPSIQKGKPVYPEKVTRLHPHVLTSYISTLYYTLEQLILDSVTTYHDIVAQNQRSEDGYTVLYWDCAQPHSSICNMACSIDAWGKAG